jgi:methyl-accepting chemotaxis protein
MAILLTNTWQTEAKIVAEKIRVIVEEKNIDIDISNEVETLFLNCTISIGVSTSSKDLKKGNDIVQQADEALYLAKEEGRNLVVIYGDK